MQSRPVSRVLSRTVIHLGRASPHASSDLPEPCAGRTDGFLFGLAPSGVYHRHACYQPRGALLPHPFTLTCQLHPEMRPTSAVCFLLHFPWARAPQALPGTMPCGARTFLPATHHRHPACAAATCLWRVTERLPGRLCAREYITRARRRAAGRARRDRLRCAGVR